MKKGKIGYFIIVSAIAWAAVIIGCALVLKGTPYKQDITNILIGGAAFHLLFIWGPLGNLFRRKNEVKKQ
jgi:hypothetical protein